MRRVKQMSVGSTDVTAAAAPIRCVVAAGEEYQHEQATQDRLVYRDEEESAKASRVGLWKDAKPVPPWKWRNGGRAGR